MLTFFLGLGLFLAFCVGVAGFVVLFFTFMGVTDHEH